MAMHLEHNLIRQCGKVETIFRKGDAQLIRLDPHYRRFFASPFRFRLSKRAAE